MPVDGLRVCVGCDDGHRNGATTHRMALECVRVFLQRLLCFSVCTADANARAREWQR